MIEPGELVTPPPGELPKIVNEALYSLERDALSQRYSEIDAQDQAEIKRTTAVQQGIVEKFSTQLITASKTVGGVMTGNDNGSSFTAQATPEYKSPRKTRPDLIFQFFGDKEHADVYFKYYKAGSSQGTFDLAVSYGELPGREDEEPLTYESGNIRLEEMQQRHYQVISYFLNRAISHQLGSDAI